MTANGWIQIGAFLVAVLALTKPLGVFMARVFNREWTFLDPVMRPVERLVYRLTGVDEQREMRWTQYTIAMMLFTGVSMLLLYLMERFQKWLPLNPQHLPNVPPDLALNTAVSFTTNTNWQAYMPETTMSYLTQMAGLAYHIFASAAVGIVLAIAVARGIARHETDTLGNFWVDMTRCFLWVELPVCLVGSLFLVSQGVIQNLNPIRPFNSSSHRRFKRPGRTKSRRLRLSARRSPKGRRPHRKSSRSSARTAAASSTPIARILSRTRPRSPISSSLC